MAHARTGIRAAVVTAVTGLATTGTNVYDSRFDPIEDDNLPAINVTTPSEFTEVEGESASSDGRHLDRRMTIEVRGHGSQTQSGTALATLLDNISEEIEEAIEADSALAALVNDMRLTATEFEYDVEGEKVAGVVVLTYEGWYVTLASNVSTAL